MKRIGEILNQNWSGGTVTGRLESATMMRSKPPLNIEMLVPPLKRSNLEALAARDQMINRVEAAFRSPVIDFAKVEARLMALFSDALKEVLREEREAQADRDETTCAAFMAAVKYGGHDLTDNNT